MLNEYPAPLILYRDFIAFSLDISFLCPYIYSKLKGSIKVNTLFKATGRSK